MTVTLSEITQAAGVSVSTVSHALNRPDYPTSKATQDRILQIADELIYEPNLNAHGVFLNRSLTHRIIAVNPDDYHDAQFMAGHQLRPGIARLGASAHLDNIVCREAQPRKPTLNHTF